MIVNPVDSRYYCKILYVQTIAKIDIINHKINIYVFNAHLNAKIVFILNQIVLCAINNLILNFYKNPK